MSGPSPLPWFAFSLTLAPELFRERLPDTSLPSLPEGEPVEALDVELVHDVPSQHWRGRVARLVNAPGQRVPGLLRSVDPAWWPQVARVERVLSLASHERPVRVRTASGAIVSARTFTPPPARRPAPGGGDVSVSFLVALAQAAEHTRLPPGYVERLQAEAHLVQTVQRAHSQRLDKPLGEPPE